MQVIDWSGVASATVTACIKGREDRSVWPSVVAAAIESAATDFLVDGWSADRR
jgi:hypothetical protein